MNDNNSQNSDKKSLKLKVGKKNSFNLSRFHKAGKDMIKI